MCRPPALSYWPNDVFSVWLGRTKFFTKLVLLCNDLLHLIKMISTESSIKFTLRLLFFIHAQVFLIFKRRQNTLNKVLTSTVRLIFIPRRHRYSLHIVLAACPSRVNIFVTGLTVLISWSTIRLFEAITYVGGLTYIIKLFSTLWAYLWLYGLLFHGWIPSESK